jgi:excisionase family DNA binding protein
LSTHEAARVLGITPRTLYRFINDGDLPAYKIGRVIRLRRGEVEEFIESTRVKPGDLDNLVPRGNEDIDDDEDIDAKDIDAEGI